MTTFQAIVFGIIHGLTEFFPVSSSAHAILVPYVLNWPEPTEALSGALALGALLALLIHFRHDWASIISCFLQVVIFRKKPMTLDERLPIFLAITSAPLAIVWYYFHEKLAEISWSPLTVALTLVAFGVPLWLSESMSRKNKNMFDWNWLDALLVGLAQAFTVIPGCGRMAAQLPGAYSRNYSREAAVKYCFYATAPVLLATAIASLRHLDFHAGRPAPDMTWMTFCVAALVTLFSGLLAIGGLMRHIQRKGMGQYVTYRVVVGIAVAIFYWIRS
jgi:undecaprenyl-diphosphatase